MSSSIDGSAVIAQLLRDKSAGTNPSTPNAKWPIFKDHLDDEENQDVICVVDEPIPTQGRIQRTKETVKQYGFTIRVRATENVDAKKKVLEIEKALESVKRDIVTVEATKYMVAGVHQTTTYTPMGQDKNKRSNYSLNYKATITRI